MSEGSNTNAVPESKEELANKAMNIEDNQEMQEPQPHQIEVSVDVDQSESASQRGGDGQGTSQASGQQKANTPAVEESNPAGGIEASQDQSQFEGGSQPGSAFERESGCVDDSEMDEGKPYRLINVQNLRTPKLR
jgi:hypothetical protein